MPIWGWIAAVLGAWLATSVPLAFLLARMLGVVDRTSDAEFDAWAAKPLTRAVAAAQPRQRDNAAA
jgi:hypothetical protein